MGENEGVSFSFIPDFTRKVKTSGCKFVGLGVTLCVNPRSQGCEVHLCCVVVGRADTRGTAAGAHVLGNVRVST